jgi:hypothetical protein
VKRIVSKHQDGRYWSFKRTESFSPSVALPLTPSAASAQGRIGTLIPSGALLVSGSKSGMNMKSIVLVSPTALRLLLVLKWRTLLPVSVASATGMMVSPERRMGLAGRFEAYGLSDVRIEEEDVEPVIES